MTFWQYFGISGCTVVVLWIGWIMGKSRNR
jgi:hypothetical protein